MSFNEVIRQVDVEEIIRNYYSKKFPELKQEHEELQVTHQQLEQELRAKQAEYDSEHKLRVGAEQGLREQQRKYAQLGREKEGVDAENRRLNDKMNEFYDRLKRIAKKRGIE